MTAVPDAIKWCYQDKNYNAGITQEPDNSVFDALVNPPASGLRAVTASVEAAQEVGVIAPDANALKGVYASVDTMKEFYDSSSVQHS